MVIDFITLLLNSDFLCHTKELIWFDFTLSLRSKPGPLFLLHFFLCLVQSLSHSISILCVHCLCDRDAEDLFLTQERWECNHISQLSKYDYRLLPWMFFVLFLCCHELDFVLSVCLCNLAVDYIHGKAFPLPFHFLFCFVLQLSLLFVDTYIKNIYLKHIWHVILKVNCAANNTAANSFWKGVMA